MPNLRRPIRSRSNEKASRKLDSVPSAITCDSETASLNDNNVWSSIYTCPPLISSTAVLYIGVGVFVLAMIWPPLILLFAYLCSKLIPYSYRKNDDVNVRRRLYQEFVRDAEDLPERFQDIHDYVNLQESYWANSRGSLLCTTTMTPKDKPIKAVVCFCHGYTDHVGFLKRVEYQRLCEAGIAFCAVEYEGHGRSDGAMGLINDWNELVGDAADYFQYMAKTRFANHSMFLMGESMGGAVCFDLYNKLPHLFRGVVFCAPMCKISDDMLPPQYVINFLSWLIGPSGTTNWLSFLPIAPSKNDFDDFINRLPEKGQLNSRCPVLYDRNPRLATARELINTTQRINKSLQDFAAPFLILHGLADRVTDPKLSQALYEESCSLDKSIKLYKEMWHSLTIGEPDESIDLVFNDVISWVLERA